MSALVIAPALPEDVLMVARNMRERDRIGVLASGRTPGEPWALERLTQSVSIYALLEDGEPIACAGFNLERPGVLGVWFVAARELERRLAFCIVRNGRRLLLAHLDKMAVHRLETTCLASWRGAARFLDVLGWRREGFHRKAGANGEDLISWAMVKE